MPFSCLIVNLLTLILKGAKGEGERDYISVREQKLPENKVGTASPELMSPCRTWEQKTLCAALGWLQHSSPVQTGRILLPVPFLAALYRTLRLKARRDGRPPRLSLGTYQPTVFCFPPGTCAG